MPGLSLSRRGIRSGYLISFLLLLISYFLIFYVQQRLFKEAGWVVHSYAIINNLESLKGELADAETGARGYVISLDVRSLGPYNSAIKKIPGLFKELKVLAAGNPVQQKRVDTLVHLFKKRLDSMANGLVKFQEAGFRITEEMRPRREIALATMDSVRLYVSRVKEEEENLMRERKLKLSALFNGAKAIAIISLGIVFVALLYSLITFNMEKKAREKADSMADKYRMDLEKNMKELQKKNIELKELRDLEKFTSTGRIARTIAHEVRNPLTNILLATEQLKELENKSGESGVLLELINRNAGRISQLVSELLNATRFAHLDYVNIEVNHLLDETLEMAKDRIELNHVNVKKEYSQDSCKLLVDTDKMKVALLNIIVNAIEAMENGKGVLELRTRKQGSKCFVEIKDNGKGMDEEVQQKLFEPYFTNKPKGNGLGLTNTQNIILNHNGKISVHSNLGKGTTFIISLDLVDKEDQSKK